ncbi:MAG: UxaA family hydrolase, partial [Roseibacillus sp.]
MSTTQAFRLHPTDNVVVAGGNFEAGQPIEGCPVVPGQFVLSGHKMAVETIAQGESVIKFGQVIGQATSEIAPGQHVHEHNLGMSAHRNDYGFGEDAQPTKFIPETERETFMGFLRGDGKVGTRNYVGIVSSVNCSATVASLIV